MVPVGWALAQQRHWYKRACWAKAQPTFLGLRQNQVIICLIGLLISVGLQAARIDLSPITIDLRDQTKIQRGATLFMNYCSGCHSLRYLRYNRLAKDLGLTTFDGELNSEVLYTNLIFTKAKINDPIQISMPAVDARQWFGIVPPDLSLIARERSPEWIYTYLKSFYVDHSKPFGANNLLVPDVAMPNIFAPLLESGQMNQQEFTRALQDLVTFLVYVGEPVKLVRYRLGVVVLIFLVGFLVVVWLLKRTYFHRT